MKTLNRNYSGGAKEEVMCKKIKIKKVGMNVYFENGEEFIRGERRAMGLGYIELRETAKAGLHVVRLSKSKNFVYALRLDKDGEYLLNGGGGYRIPALEEIKDPVKKFVRAMGFRCPVERKKAGETLEVILESGERLYTDGEEEITRIEEEWEERKVSKATYAVVRYVKHCMNGGVLYYPGKVWIWPGFSDEKGLKAALLSSKWAARIDKDYIDALEGDKEKAIKWVRSIYWEKKSGGREIRILYRDWDKTFNLETGKGYKPLEEIVNVYGKEILQHLNENNDMLTRLFNEGHV